MKIVILSLIGGVVITVLTGLLSNMPTMLLGAEHYGYPLAWLFRLVLAPEYFPWRVDATAMVADVIVWSIIVAAVLFVFTRLRR
jgi:hypothetical protein